MKFTMTSKLHITSLVALIVLKKANGKSNKVLDGAREILEVVGWFGMKFRWVVEHLSMEASAAIVVRNDKFKRLPPTGFAFMVSCSFFYLLFDIHLMIVDVAPVFR